MTTSPAESPPTTGTSRPVIVVDNVSKAYRPQTHQVSLRHEAMKVVQQALRRRGSTGDEPFWALRHINFSVRPGEGLAIVGRNGSGKTTMLRILAGITRPTEGSASVRGRFAALIGLGAGFNLELTGRQNVYLNAAIHGVDSARVSEFIGDIIDFAELGEYIDAPVKRYSSGMVARLGFSIAAHIFPDIVFLDEVLAVGDAAFQEKCTERILTLRSEGRTILFVSHLAAAVRLVCDRAVWIDHGELQLDGPVDEVLEAYHAHLHATEASV